MTTTTNDDGKLDNMTVRRFAKLLKNNGANSNTSTPITTGTVVQNDNSLYVAVDDDTLVPISDTNSNVSVGDTVTLALDDNKALIVGNITDTNATTSEVKQTNVKVAKAQATAEGAEKVATNYIDIDENKGITVGNMQDDTLGHNTYIDTNGVSIRDGETVLASFEDDEIALGKNSENAIISLCDNVGKISVNEDHNLLITAGNEGDDYANSIMLAPVEFIKDGVNRHSVSTFGAENVYVAVSELSDTENRWGALQITPTGVTINASDMNRNVSRLKVCNEGCYIALSGEYAKVYGETVLYNNASGTTSTVTLSESAANFTYLEIYYKMSINNMCGSVKIYSANNKYATISETFWNNNAAQTEYLSLVISETSIQRNAERYTKANGSTVTVGLASTPLIYITRVVGIK